MKQRFEKAVLESTELKALLALGLLLCLRAWRAIPHLHPIQILVPATLLQMIVFIVAALNRDNLFFILAIGNFIVVGLALFPMTLAKPKPSVDQVKIEK